MGDSGASPGQRSLRTALEWRRDAGGSTEIAGLPVADGGGFLMSVVRREFFARAGAALGACLAPRLNVAADAQAAAARDVPWLNQVLDPPSTASAPARPLAPVLLDENGRTITTLADWRRRRAALERTWHDLLGSLNVARGDPPRVEIVAEDRVDDVVRQRVRYLAEPDLPTEAYVLKPRAPRGKCPGVIVLHTTTPESIRQPAGLSDVREKHFGLALARRGFVAFCPRNFLWPETTRMAAAEETRRFRQRHPRARGMAKMLFDSRVALDILAARSDVDTGRIGCIGHSLGAKEALYLAAFDPRVTAVVSSEGGIGTTMSNWDAEWYLGNIVKEPGFVREHHELIALAAPRPFLLVGGDSADGAASWPWIEAARPVYRLYGAARHLGLLNHKGGHAVPPVVEPRLLDWIETYA
jgi:dienelactone hydrolase